MTATGTAADNSRPWREAATKDGSHTRRLCKCHTPAMGHHFGGDDLRCRCGCGILTHWRKLSQCKLTLPKPRKRKKESVLEIVERRRKERGVSA